MGKNNTLNTPVLLTIYNRPDITKRVFLEISTAKPQKLYIAADGPKDKKRDNEKCRTARDIVKNIDWDCEVHYLLRERNLGCGLGVSTALSWFFENETEGIILEDDTLPNQSFFWFCQELLERYRDDERIMVIGGDNFQNGIMRGNGSYYFSHYPQTWGWAGWRRAWKFYDFKISDFPKFRDQNQIRNILDNELYQQYWLKVFELTYKGKIDTWDYQWVFTIWNRNGLCITPNVNLVSNIGCGHKDATFVKNPDDELANRENYDIKSMIHPTFIFPDKEADDYDSKNTFQIDSNLAWMKWS
jgi:hypothetical protein